MPINSVKKVFRGDSWKTPEPSRSAAEDSGAASTLARLLEKDIIERHQSWGTGGWPPQGEADSSRRLAGSSEGTYARSSVRYVGPVEPEDWKKGDLIRGVPSDVSLPNVGAEGVPVVGAAAEVAAQMSDIKSNLIRAEEDVDWVKYRSIKSYYCPGLAKKRAMLALALRMYLAGMLGYTDYVAETLFLFKVTKKLLDTGRWMQRLVIDYRRGNLLFRTPPWLPMASPALRGWLELDSDASGDLSFFSTVGDVPDYYSRG